MTIPKKQDAAPTIFQLSTPIAVIGMYVDVIRQRFIADANSDPELNWTWEEDLSTTRIFIESGYNVNLEARTTRPGVWVDREQNHYLQWSIGNQDQIPRYIQTGMEVYYAPCEMDMMVDCTSPNRGESMLVGSIVQDFLQLTTPLINRCYSVRSVSPMVLGKTQKYEEDDTLWNTRINFRINYEMRWSTGPATVALNRLKAQIIGGTAGGETRMVEIALNREGTPV